MLSSLRRFFFPVSIIGLVAVLFVVYRVSGPVTAIKGTYALIGLVLAATLYLLTSADGDGPPREALKNADHYWVVVLPLAVLAVIAAVTVDRIVALVAFVPLCYALIGYQWLARVPAPRLLPQIVATFLVGPTSKYLTTGFYFGATDLLGHVRAGQNLQRTGELTSIISAYPTYEHFPGLHISTVGVSTFTGLQIYDSLLLLGLVAYSVFIVLVYLLFAKVSSKDLAMAATILFSAITQVSYYSNYFFPQAFATVLLIGLIYFALNIGLSVSVRRTRMVVFSTLLGIGVIFSHHMTVILFSLILSLYFVGHAVVQLLQRKTQTPIVEDSPQPFVLLFTGICALSYWTLYTAGFLRYFSSFVYELIFVQSPIVSDSGGVRAVVGLGLAVPQHTPQVALRSLAAVDGIYYITLTAVAVLGLVAILYKPAKHSEYAGYLFVGFASVPFLLRTPIINISRRLSLPMSAFFALFGGIGLLFIANRISSRTTRRLLIAAIVILGTTSPLVAADDQYAFHAGPNLYEAYSSPEEQVEFSDQEYAELRAMSDRLRLEDSEVTTLWVTRLAIEHFGGEAEGRARVTDCGITSPSPFVYRTEWKDHQVGFEGNTVGTAVISPTWLDTQVDQANKVYTTGKTGILWSESEIVLGDRSETNRITC